MNRQNVFNISSSSHFETLALEVFNYQYTHNPVYQNFCSYLKVHPQNVQSLKQIPFLPIQFFKSHKIISGSRPAEKIFTSSGTTGSTVSKHFVTYLDLYIKSFQTAFRQFYGPAQQYVILALLPSYLERDGSSLIYMTQHLIESSGHKESGFYLHDLHSLHSLLRDLESKNVKTLLLGVTFALLDFAEKYPMPLKNTFIMETGGMKGRRKEMIRDEVHKILCNAFKVPEIHSEYGMTELLSQAYSKGKGVFRCPPWMKVLTRDTEDPLSFQTSGRTGGINVIDLANIYSCSFIATQDLGKVYEDGSFEILGRFDHSDIRGCNLMAL
ncbi:acyl transferase [Ascidiimonas aurantiaca]|uniref:LuxE/PaaK family acyltransferase n=1 Tax=Ascidiimonas aurantiaca TaxID=1685432 RepID=UPI0030EC22C9